jgi:hypothetical protein
MTQNKNIDICFGENPRIKCIVFQFYQRFVPKEFMFNNLCEEYEMYAIEEEQILIYEHNKEEEAKARENFIKHT